MARLGRWWSGIALRRTATSGAQLDALDGLRGVAVALVVLSHASGLFGGRALGFDFAGAGKYGVYLFFVLSAFLLTRQILVHTPATLRAPLTWLRYAARRLLRIFPAYTLVLLIDLILTRSGLHPGFQMHLDSFFRHLMLVEGSGIYWTIPVEFQYYLLLPLVGLLFAIVLRARPGLALPLGVAMIAGASMVWPGHDSPNQTLSLGPYLPLFFAGSLAAVVHVWIESRKWPRGTPARLGFEFIAAACLVAVYVMIPSVWQGLTESQILLDHFHRDHWLFGLLWSACLLGVLHGSGAFRALLSTDALRFVGIVSFSLYLWHLLVLRLVRQALDWSPTAEAALMIAGSLMAATLSYVLIEHPFLRLGARIGTRPKV